LWRGASLTLEVRLEVVGLTASVDALALALLSDEDDDDDEGFLTGEDAAAAAAAAVVSLGCCLDVTSARVLAPNKLIESTQHQQSSAALHAAAVIAGKQAAHQSENMLHIALLSMQWAHTQQEQS
jgi:hypothetical protein